MAAQRIYFVRYYGWWVSITFHTSVMRANAPPFIAIVIRWRFRFSLAFKLEQLECGSSMSHEIITITTATAATHFKLCKLKIQLRSNRKKGNRSKVVFVGFCYCCESAGISYYASWSAYSSFCISHTLSSSASVYFNRIFLHFPTGIAALCAVRLLVLFANVMRLNLKHLHPLHSFFVCWRS